MEFKPGAYTKGDIVTVNGVQYVADRDMLNAQAIPKDNMYWTRVEEPIPPPKVVFEFVPLVEGDNHKILQDIIDQSPQTKLYLPNGKFHFSDSIIVFNKGIQLIGNGGTQLVFGRGISGIKLFRDHSTPRPLLKDLELIGNKEIESHGIEVTTVAKIESVIVRNFGGKGIAFRGGVPLTDTSHSKVYDTNVIECSGDGFYMQGGDSNCMSFFSCDARDNGGIGFYDNSFLGNHFFGCMAHYNAGGDFVADGGNNRATFTGCYSEGQSVKSRFAGAARVFGGLFGTDGEQYELSGFAQAFCD